MSIPDEARISVTQDDIVRVIKGNPGLEMVQIAAVLGFNPPIAPTVLHQFRGLMSALKNRPEVYKDDTRRWYSSEGGSNDYPASRHDNSGSVAPRLKNRKGIELTIHQTHLITDVIKVEYLIESNWQEMPSFASMHMYLCPELCVVDLTQSKNRGVKKVRVTRKAGSEQSTEEIVVPNGWWVILSPELEG